MSRAALTHHNADANGTRIHYVRAGSGPLVLLLHGWPQSWRCWRGVIPALAERFTVVAPDLPGFGDSGKRAAGYDKRGMAEDLRALVQALGLGRVSLVGHDVGAVVTYPYAALHPGEVERLAILDVPPLGVGPASWTGAQPWHWGFHAQVDIAEALIRGREHLYLRHWFAGLHPHAITTDDLDDYARCMAQPGSLRAGLECFRAFPRDVAFNKEAARTPLPMPVLALGGARSLGSAALDAMRQLATDVRGGVLPGCGHWIAEEAPEALLAHLLPFLDGEPDGRERNAP